MTRTRREREQKVKELGIKREPIGGGTKGGNETEQKKQKKKKKSTVLTKKGGGRGTKKKGAYKMKKGRIGITSSKGEKTGKLENVDRGERGEMRKK